MGNQDLMTEKKSVPHSQYSTCQARDDNSTGSDETDQLLLHCYTEESVRSCGPYRKASLDLCVFKEEKTKKWNSGAAL